MGGDALDDAEMPWAVIVSTSRYFHNYRHASSALSVYAAVRRLGVPDSNIILMLAGAIPCDVRNSAAGSMYNSASHKRENLYPSDVQVDYRGEEVTVEALLGLITDQISVPASRRLRSSAGSRVLIYLTGHGGDEFLKFGDQFELTATELAAAVELLFAQRRCAELLLIVDTCEGSSLFAHIGGPSTASKSDVLSESSSRCGGFPSVCSVSIASSALGEKSYSRELDRGLGVSVSDRFTYHLQLFLASASADASLAELQDQLRRSRLLSSVVVQTHGWRGDPGALRVRSFFGGAKNLQSSTVMNASVLQGSTGMPAAAMGERARLLSRRAPAAHWRAVEARALTGRAFVGGHKALESHAVQVCEASGTWSSSTGVQTVIAVILVLATTLSWLHTSGAKHAFGGKSVVKDIC